MDEEIKAKTEVLVDGYLREFVRDHRDAETTELELPLELNRLCIDFIYLKLVGVAQTIMWRIYNGTLNEYINDGSLAQVFNNCSSEKKVQIADHCVQNQVVAPLKVMVDHVFSIDNDLVTLLIISAIKHASFGGLSVLERATDERTRDRAVIVLYNAVKYNADCVLLRYIMSKLGMFDNIYANKMIAQKMTLSFPETMKRIITDYGTEIAGGSEIQRSFNMRNQKKDNFDWNGWDDDDDHDRSNRNKKRTSTDAGMNECDSPSNKKQRVI
eukprot:286408_1